MAKALKAWEKEKNTVEKAGLMETSSKLRSDTPVPTKEQMEQLLVNKKKEEMLRRYASDQLIADLDKGKKEVEVVLGKRKQ